MVDTVDIANLIESLIAPAGADMGDPGQGVDIRSGDGNALGGAGGPIEFRGGSAVGDDVGGTATLRAGNGNINGGDANLRGGGGVTTGNGGPAVVKGGDSGSTSGEAGQARLIGGECTNGGTGAAAIVAGGDGFNGGSVIVLGRNATGGVGGDVTIRPGLGDLGSGNLILSDLPTSDPVVPGALWIDGGVTLKISAGA